MPNGQFDHNEQGNMHSSIAQHAKLTILSSTNIHPQGLFTTLKRYKDRCVPIYAAKIESIIGEIEKMIAYDDAQLHTFVYTQDKQANKIDYIGLAVRKVNDQAAKPVFNYVIYTYTFEEPVAVQVEKSWYQKNPFAYPTKNQPSKQINIQDRIEELKSCFFAELIKQEIVMVSSNGEHRLKINL